jgi:hypothetical protein
LKAVVQRRVAARRLDCLMVFHHDGDEDMNDWWKAWKAACKLAGLPGKKAARLSSNGSAQHDP